MMASIRVLNEKGIELFRDYIIRVKVNPKEPSPIDKLSNTAWSSEFSPHIEVGNVSASMRMELGKNLVDLFENNNVERKELLNNPGMWSWLALLWFDILCPIESDGSRKVRETARYVCSSHYTDYYRHLVAASWDIFYLHGENSRLFLSTPLNIHSDFIEQLASRQNIITNKALIEAFNLLYWDVKLSHPKSGSQSRNRSGNFRRLRAFVQQIERTYDLYAMSAKDILGLLPSEYDPWKSSS